MVLTNRFLHQEMQRGNLHIPLYYGYAPLSSPVFLMSLRRLFIISFRCKKRYLNKSSTYFYTQHYHPTQTTTPQLLSHTTNPQNHVLHDLLQRPLRRRRPNVHRLCTRRRIIQAQSLRRSRSTRQAPRTTAAATTTAATKQFKHHVYFEPLDLG